MRRPAVKHLQSYMVRMLHPQSRRLLTTESNNPRIRDRRAVAAAAATQRRQKEAVDRARWASSWMMPWERAQMDSPTRPLKLWERVYWRLFVVLGGVGFAYETWVLGNRRLWVEEAQPSSRDAARRPNPHAVARQAEGWYHARDMHSGRLLTDDEVVDVVATGHE